MFENSDQTLRKALELKFEAINNVNNHKMVMNHEDYYMKKIRNDVYKKMSLKSNIDVNCYVIDSGDESDEVN